MAEIFEALGVIIDNGVVYNGVFYISYREIVCILIGILATVIFDAIYTEFDLSKNKEFTVEAGRPDTITKEKLNVIKNFGIDRISINPQSMNPETLKIIGRNHI